MTISPLEGIGNNRTGNAGISISGISGNVEFCDIMTFTPVIETNSTGVWSGMQLTVTNDGVGAGIYQTVSDQSWTSANGKVSAEIKFNSATITSGTIVSVGFRQGINNMALVGYIAATGQIFDQIASTVLETISPTIGEFVLGITLDQSAGTATYSYKLNDSASPSSNAATSVSGTYNNASATTLYTPVNTPTSGVVVITANSSQTAFVTNVDGQGYCSYS